MTSLIREHVLSLTAASAQSWPWQRYRSKRRTAVRLVQTRLGRANLCECVRLPWEYLRGCMSGSTIYSFMNQLASIISPSISPLAYAPSFWLWCLLQTNGLQKENNGGAKWKKQKTKKKTKRNKAHTPTRTQKKKKKGGGGTPTNKLFGGTASHYINEQPSSWIVFFGRTLEPMTYLQNLFTNRI